MVKQHGGSPTGIVNGTPSATGTGDVLKQITDMMAGMGQKGGKKGRKGSRRGHKNSRSRRGHKNSRSRRGHKNSSRRGRKGSKKGGQGVIATAAVPFGLLALQRYFKGSKTSKQGVQNMGNSLKRTLRFKSKSRKHRKH
jgi:hypothetical protein